MSNLKGMEEILKRFDARTSKLDASAIVNGGALIVQGQAINIAPVAEKNGGTLRDSISVEKAKNSKRNATALVYTPIDYGVYQEFGTVKMKAQPFMHPAVQLATKKVQAYGAMMVRKAMKS